ncbi:MAG: peptidylprolyl isomerase, partial [Bdellovibrionales bacterium]
ETDIDAELDILRENIGGAQYRIAEIVLNVDAATQEAEIRQTAQKIYQQLQAQPQSFPAVAQQFSQVAGAAQGGNLGWVETGQIDQELENALKQMAKGSISPPIRTDGGYHIVLLQDKRSLSEENLPSRDDILSKIGNQRLERQAKSYLLDLKASAFIENRV